MILQDILDRKMFFKVFYSLSENYDIFISEWNSAYYLDCLY